MEYLKSIIPVIESNYHTFTILEKNIADYFIQNRNREDFSSKAVSKRLFVSEASLSRFAKKCGFRGYREFLYQYENEFVEKNNVVTNRTKMILNTYQELLDKTYSLIDEKQIVEICRYMSGANRVFVCGMGSSGLAAREMELRFMRIGVDINSMDHSDMIKMRAVFQDPNCLVVGISISGETKEILFLLKEAYKRQAKTVLFTARRKEEYDSFCHQVVLLPSLYHLDHGNVVSPQFPALVMMDICYAYYVSQDQYIKEAHHDDTLRVLQEGEHTKFLF